MGADYEKSLFLLFIWQKLLIRVFPNDLQHLVEMEQQLSLQYDNLMEEMSNHEQYLAREFKFKNIGFLLV